MDILNLSDLHFRPDEDIASHLAHLVEDLCGDLDCQHLDAVILAGDVADKALDAEYTLASEFVRRLLEEFHVPTGGLLVVPGNHDVDWSVSKAGFQKVIRKDYAGNPNAEFVYDSGKGKSIQTCDPNQYKSRFSNFARFYQTVTGMNFSLEYDLQYCVNVFEPARLIVIGLNSAWCLDHLRPGQPAIREGAVNRILNDLSKLPDYRDYHKLAVWHHPIQSSDDDRIRDSTFVERLTKFGFRIGFHGHVHELGAQWFRYELGATGRNMEIIAAGTFGAPTKQLPVGTPWEYNLLRFRDGFLTVESRFRKRQSAPWRPYGAWQEGGQEARPHYRIELRTTPARPVDMSQRSELLSHLKAEGIDAVGYRIAVEANIFDSEGKLLLQRRGPGARDEHGKLEGVGGDLGRSTDLHQALLDRIRSEIGDAAVVHIERLFEVRPVVFEEPHGAQDWIVVSYLCRLISGTPRIVDRALTSELSRFTLDEIYALPDAQLSRSTSRFLALYRARFGTVPYFAASHG